VHRGAGGAEAQRRAVHGLDLTGRSEAVGIEGLAGDDVVGEDAGEEVLVGEDGVEVGGRDGGEGVVGGGEDGEGSVAVEGVDEAGGLHGGDEGRQDGVVGGGGGGGVVGHAGEAALTVGGHRRARGSE